MLNQEEIDLWNYVFINTNHKDLSIENFSKIFYSASYFSSIAGISADEHVTDSILIALDYENKFYFIHAVEYIVSIGDSPSYFNLDVVTTENHDDLFKNIPADWVSVKNDILHYVLDQNLNHKQNTQNKLKI